jgi:hypothetical protein
MLRCRIASGCTVLGVLVVAGCTGGGAGFRGTILAEKRYKVEAALAPGKSLAFPADMPLNVHDKLSTQTPGPDGTARGDAGAEPAGNAVCNAEASKGGSAMGRFHVGHCLDNRTDASLLADVEFTVEYEVDANCVVTAQTVAAQADAAAAGPLAVVTLTAIIKDSNEKIIQTMSLANESDDLGRVRKQGTETARFSVEMEPSLAYTIALVGEATVTTSANDQATASVAIKKLAITVTGRS